MQNEVTGCAFLWVFLAELISATRLLASKDFSAKWVTVAALKPPGKLQEGNGTVVLFDVMSCEPARLVCQRWLKL